MYQNGLNFIVKLIYNSTKSTITLRYIIIINSNKIHIEHISKAIQIETHTKYKLLDIKYYFYLPI